MASYERTINDTISVSDAIVQERVICDSISVSDSLVTQKIETLEISNARVLTSTKVRIDFSAPTLINSALQDPNSYTFDVISAGAIDVIPQSVDLPPGQSNPLFVEVNVTEHTDGAIYSVEISSDIQGANGEIGGGPAKQYAGAGEPPTVILVLATDKNHALVYFSEAILNNASANDINNYVWDNGLQTLGIESITENVVALKTTEQTQGQLYNLTVRGILSITLRDSIAITDNVSSQLTIPFITEWTVAGDVAARTITLPLVQNRAEGALNYNCIVDWGDGTPISYITSYDDVDRIHTYASDGTFQVKISGVMEGWSFNNGGDRLKITKVIHWGNSVGFDGFKYLKGGFFGCSNLTQLGTGSIGASSDGCNYDGFQDFGRSCSSLSTLPSNIFSKHVNAKSFFYAFRDTPLTSVPSDLFANNTLASNFKGVFRNNTVLTSVPSGLFDYNTATTTFAALFYGCTSLTSIPSGLFNNNTAVTDFSELCVDCTSLTSIPSGLFDNNTSVTTFAIAFSNCSALTSIPTGLFDNNTAVTTFSYAFKNTPITSIPSGLFDYNTAVTDFSYVFSDCSSLTTVPSGLFDYNTAVTNFAAVFRYCISLASIPSGLFDNNTAVTAFNGAFDGCTNLATTPNELFRYNTAVANFVATFMNCNKLQQKIDLFYAAGEESTRFLNQSPNFTNCFKRDSFTGTQGTAPDLWNCNFGTGTPTRTDCWEGAGNSTTSLTNYASIPGDWI